MSLISISYFFGEINLPTADPNEASVITDFINDKEPEYLKASLGYSFWKLFTDGLVAEEQRFKDLRDGKEYTDSKGIVRKWEGLINTAKKSPIANYVYHYYTQNNITTTTGIGEQEEKAVNSSNASARLKAWRNYNKMVESTWLMWNFLNQEVDEANTRIYPEFDVKQCERFAKMAFI